MRDNKRIVMGDLARLVKKLRKNMNAFDILASVIFELRDCEFIEEEE